MATHKIGNLKFNLSKKGLAFRMGEGEIRRLRMPFGGKDDPEGYSPYGPDGEEARLDEEQDLSYEEEDGYADDGYADEGYADDGYADDGYADEGYADEGYADDAYADGDVPDASEGDYYADEEGYYSGDGEYSEEGAPEGGFLGFVENHLWLIWALLVVLPPLGIWLLWHFRRHDNVTRWVLTAASAVWFVLILVLLFSGVLKGGSDDTAVPGMILTSVRPTVTAFVPEDEGNTEEEDEGGVRIEDLMGDEDPDPDADVQPSATPLGGVPQGEEGEEGVVTADENGNVYSPQTGLYYHADPTCSKIGSATVTLVTLQAARNRNQSACPLCCGGTIYYATSTGKYYHTDRECDGMKNAVEYSREAAEAEGKTACPKCAGGTEKAAATTKPTAATKAQAYALKIKKDRSGLKVYMTKNGKNYHSKKDCKGMKGASQVTLLKALQSGKTACPSCCGYLNNGVYCTAGGKSYHTNATCKGMTGASQVNLSMALVLGKSRCTTCVGSNFYTTKSAVSGDGTVYVYATSNGKYYHSNSTCDGMKNATKVTLAAAIKAGRPACPKCCGKANTTVYARKGGKYYHSYATCSNMKGASSGTLAQALAAGYKACPDCWGTKSKGSSSSSASSSSSSASAAGKSGSTSSDKSASGVYVYATSSGKYYHAKASCSKLGSGAVKCSLEKAVSAGKDPCPTCCANAKDTVYVGKGSSYYHKNATCSGITNVKSGSLVKAVMNGYDACPVCYGSSGGTKKSPKKNTYTSGTSGMKVYTTVSGKYYHTKAKCSKLSGAAVYVTLETALNYGKTGCPVCASSADRTVYGVSGGRYYHFSASCAGSGASAGSLQKALALGLKACPACVTGKSGGGNEGETRKTYTPGTSGIKVYAKPGAKYYHSSGSCGNLSDAMYVSLETALNYGLTGCPKCCTLGNRTVYAVSGSKTYHASKTCAGSGAKAGKLSKALALGMKACPKCVTGEDSGKKDPEREDNSAPASTIVYIDLNSSAMLYHAGSSCSDTGMKKGTKVTLQYAMEQGYTDCSYCNPPNRIQN